jgi:hypothetical protein
VDDLQLWDHGTERLKVLLSGLSGGTGQKMACLLTLYRKAKETYAAIVAAADAASICGDCKGQCCHNGKYRISVFDVMARIATEKSTAADFTRKPVCPYGTDSGCLMEPGLRPADCVLFICDDICLKLSPRDELQLAEQEELLRGYIHDASCLTGEALGTPLLLWAAKQKNPILLQTQR